MPLQVLHQSPLAHVQGTRKIHLIVNGIQSSVPFRNKLASRKTKVQSYYLDMNLLMKYWKVNPEESRM